MQRNLRTTLLTIPICCVENSLNWFQCLVFYRLSSFIFERKYDFEPIQKAQQIFHVVWNSCCYPSFVVFWLLHVIDWAIKINWNQMNIVFFHTHKIQHKQNRFIADQISVCFSIDWFSNRRPFSHLATVGNCLAPVSTNE